LRKIIKIVTARCHILRLKCTKFDSDCGSVPDPAGELTVLPRPIAGFKSWKGGEGKRTERKWKGTEGRKGGFFAPPAHIYQYILG